MENIYHKYNMGSYYYLKDKNSDFGYTPIPEEEYTGAIFRIAKKKGVEITDKMILNDLENKKRNNKGRAL